MYRKPVNPTGGAAGAESRALGLRLRFATVSVYQFGSSSCGESNLRPTLGRVAGFEWRPNHARRDELVKAAGCLSCLCARRDEFRYHAAMSGDRDTFAGFDPPDVAAQIVLELSDTGGSHTEV